jgi:hypothetical protein
MTTPDILSWLAQAGIAGVGAIGIMALALPGKIGDRLLSFQFDRRLAIFRDSQEQELEKLRASLRHVGDRGQRLNEKEYEALSEIWKQFIDVLLFTERAIAQFIEHPDLKKMNDEETKRFLESTELSEEQKRSVSEAGDKNDAYSQTVRWLAIAKAHNQVFEIRTSLKIRSIFIPENIVTQFEQAVELCSKAVVSEFVRFRNPGSSVGFDESLAFLEKKDNTFTSLRDATREHLLRNLKNW